MEVVSKEASSMQVIVNFSNLLVAIILLILGLLVFTRHRIASYLVGGFLVVLAALSVLSYLGILKPASPGSIHIG
jgi:uncharacterized membrane protein YkgB